MKKPCLECGHPVEVFADECPKCACWLDTESTLYLRAAFFLIYVLTFWGTLWILNREEPPVNPKPSAAIHPGTALPVPSNGHNVPALKGVQSASGRGERLLCVEVEDVMDGHRMLLPLHVDKRTS